jgi:hypothetical protein
VFVNTGGYNCYTTCLIDEQAVGSCSSHEMSLPSESYLWVPIILHAMGGSVWAMQFVPALPSREELQADSALDSDWSLDDLVVAVREAIWGDSASVYLHKEDISMRTGGFVYFQKDFQEQLSTCLQNHPAYKGAQTWMLSRFTSARDKVIQFTPCTTDLMTI